MVIRPPQFPEGFNRSYEWSLQVGATFSSVRDKDTWWGTPRQLPLGATAVDSLHEMLRAQGAPKGAYELLHRALPGLRGIGIGAGHLYLHHRPPGTYTDRYDAWTWSVPGDEGAAAEYRFHYFPPETGAIDALPHPSLLPVWQALCADPLLRAGSGYWTRHRKGLLDQVCLSWPWMPPLATLLPALRLLAPDNELLESVSGHHVRHVAFTTAERTEASLTLYFQGSAPLPVYESPASLREAVCNEASGHYKDIYHQVYADLFVPPAAANGIGEFYDTTLLPLWQQVLGPSLHYHFGLFAPGDDPESEAPFVRAVSELARFIPDGARVYDLGCGWCGPAHWLAREKGCDVTGVTLSRSGVEWGRSLGLEVRHADIEATLPPGYFDTFLMIESLEHIRNKFGLLRRLRRFGSSLVLRTHCQEDGADDITFDGTMHLLSPEALRRVIGDAGWTIRHWKNRRPESMPTIGHWRARLAQVPPQDDRHFETFRAFCDRVAAMPEAWAREHPLIEVWAE